MATIGAVAYNFVAPERDQLYLLPPSMADWLAEDHLAWFVLDCVEEMDLSAFYGDYREDGWGGAAHHPKTMGNCSGPGGQPGVTLEQLA